MGGSGSQPRTAAGTDSNDDSDSPASSSDDSSSSSSDHSSSPSSMTRTGFVNITHVNVGGSGSQPRTAAGTDSNDDSDSSASSSDDSSSSSSDHPSRPFSITRTGSVNITHSFIRNNPQTVDPIFRQLIRNASRISSNSGAMNVNQFTPQQSSDASRTASAHESRNTAVRGRSRSRSPTSSTATRSTAQYRDRPVHRAHYHRPIDTDPGRPSGQRSGTNPSPGSGANSSPSNAFHIRGDVHNSGGGSSSSVTVGDGIRFVAFRSGEVHSLGVTSDGDSTAQGRAPASQDSDSDEGWTFVL